MFRKIRNASNNISLEVALVLMVVALFILATLGKIQNKKEVHISEEETEICLNIYECN